MIAVKENEGVYLAHFTQLEKTLEGNAPSWAQEIRRAAIERFAELGFPTTHEEEWKFTNLAPIVNTPFQPAPPGRSPAVIAEKLRRSSLSDLGCTRLVFINGRYSKELSTPESLPKGVKAGSLAEMLARDGAALQAHLTHYADYKDHAFVALNTAFLEDGAFIEIPRGLVLEKPIYLLFVSDAQGGPTVSHPRNLIVAGRESQAAVIEGYLGLTNQVYFTNAVTELVVDEGAVFDHHKVQQEAEQALHYARVEIHQARSSSVATHSVALGGALVREEVRAVLDGDGAETTLNGLYVITGQQHVDNHTTLDHAKPHCNSREFYKGVLDGRASGVFDGKIIVRKDAQKTDSKQSNKNLLLSEDAAIDTKPQLEIYADDVKCTHGATIGQIDAEAVFYLRSRGLGLQEARDLLIYAFANDILERIKFDPLRERLKAGLFARLARGSRAEEA